MTSRHRCFKDGMVALRDALGTLVKKIAFHGLIRAVMITNG